MRHLILAAAALSLLSSPGAGATGPHAKGASDAHLMRSRGSVWQADRDNDGLTDEEEARLGTSPTDPDSDDDALLDGWEVRGVNGIDLAGMGALPLHKDLFVEMDFMVRSSAANGLGPNDAVLRGIAAVFAAAPVTNPDNRPGINVHLERGNQVVYDSDLNPLLTEFGALKRANFDTRRAPVFHYMIWANGYDGDTSSGYSMAIPGADFVVTLGKWNGGNGGTDNQKIGTFVHELGHNLGLRHGGSDAENFKPNHLSVMNYSFQTRGILHDNGRAYDYQRFPLPALPEAALREADGLGRGAALQTYNTIFYSGQSAFEVPCHDAIDWNRNGTINTSTVSLNLNSGNTISTLSATPNEWASVSYDGGAIGSRLSPAAALNMAARRWRRFRFKELTEEMDRRVGEYLLRGERSGNSSRRELDEETDREIERALRRGRRRRARP